MDIEQIAKIDFAKRTSLEINMLVAFLLNKSVITKEYFYQLPNYISVELTANREPTGALEGSTPAGRGWTTVLRDYCASAQDGYPLLSDNNIYLTDLVVDGVYKSVATAMEPAVEVEGILPVQVKPYLGYAFCQTVGSGGKLTVGMTCLLKKLMWTKSDKLEDLIEYLGGKTQEHWLFVE